MKVLIGSANAAADCAVSSEPRKKQICEPANRHQCCMYIDADFPVAFTVNVQWTVATTSVSFAVSDTTSNSVTSTLEPISLKNRGTSLLPRKLPHQGTAEPAASAAQSTSSASSARTASTSPRP